MKNLGIHIKHLISPALVGLLTLIALLSYSWGQPASSVLANREASSDIAHQTSLLTTTTGGSPSSSLSKLHQPTQPPISETYGKMPLYFIENRGQVDSRVAYYVQGIDKSVYFTPEGITFVLTGKVARHGAEPSSHNASLRSVSLRTEAHTEDAMQEHILKLDFIGARRGVRPTGQDPTSATISYFKGAKDQWKTGLKTYATLTYSDLWPGIDLIYTGTVEQMKYTFIVKPGADPNQIRLAYRGASEVGLNGEGQLEVSTPVGGFHDEKPYSYQEVEGNRVEVATAYALEAGGIAGSQVYGFSLGNYDKSNPLTLDPVMRIYTGFIGGEGSDEGKGIATNGEIINLNGLPQEVVFAYVVGTTTSDASSFPDGQGIRSLPGLPKPICRDGGAFGCPHTDAFVVKVNYDGSGLVYASYIGGGNDEDGRGIAVDTAGQAYITGVTNSADFPHVPIMPTLTYQGGNDAFVVRLNQSGTGLVYSVLIGGTDNDEGNAIAVDDIGSAYVTGSTNSAGIQSFGTFPAEHGPNDFFNGGDSDAFVAKVNQNGTGLVYCGYIGGIHEDVGKGIAVDKQGRAYVTGHTNSTQDENFPVSIGPDLEFNSGVDAFVARVSKADGSDVQLEYCGYIGGLLYDEGNSIAVDSTNPDDVSAYITGTTFSNQFSFPNGRGFDNLPGTFAGPNSTYNGNGDAFVVKLSESSAFVYAGYIGGSDAEAGRGIAVDANGNAYITGFTQSNGESPGEGFPNGLGIDSFSGPDRVLTGERDAFIVRVTLDVGSGGEIRGFKFDLVSYIGGVGEEEGNGIAVDKDGNAYVTGFTNSPRLDSDRFRVPASPDRTFNGGDSDAFVEKIGAATSRVRPPTPIRSLCPDDITVTALPGENSAVVNYPPPNVGHLADVIVVSSPPPGSVFPVGTTEVTIIEIDTFGDTGVLCTFTVTVNPAGPPPLALSCVGGLHVVVPPGQPTVVNYPLPVLNKPEGATVVCLPPPGSVFPVGMTTVTCTATNTLGETAACSFIVDVVE